MEIVIIGSNREVFPFGPGLLVFASPQRAEFGALKRRSTKTPLLPGEMNLKTAGAVIVKTISNIPNGERARLLW
jgi:hypothetical protein